MKLQSKARALVACELVEGFALSQDDSKTELQSKARALVARNFLGALLLKKGAVK